MDSFTHTWVGWAVGRCFPEERWGRWVAPVAMVSANLPDFEVFFVRASDRPFYLLHHRGWSHSILGIAAEALVFSALIFAVLAWLHRRAKRSDAAPPQRRIGRPRFGAVLLLVSVEATLHLFLDWWNTYGVRPFYPFDETWYYGDLAFILDPWIWLILGLFLSIGSRTRRRQQAWAGPLGVAAARRLWALVVAHWLLNGVAAIVLLIFFAHYGLIGTATVWVWGGGFAAACVFVRYAPAWAPRPCAAAALLIIAGYIALLGIWSRSAVDVAIDEHGPGILASELIIQSSANPVPVIPWRREVIIETRRTIHQISVNALTGRVVGTSRRPRNLDAPELSHISDTPQFIAWRSFARHPIVERRSGRLVLGDARYQLTRRRRDWSALEVRVPIRSGR